MDYSNILRESVIESKVSKLESIQESYEHEFADMLDLLTEAEYNDAVEMSMFNEGIFGGNPGKDIKGIKNKTQKMLTNLNRVVMALNTDSRVAGNAQLQKTVTQFKDYVAKVERFNTWLGNFNEEGAFVEPGTQQPEEAQVDENGNPVEPQAENTEANGNPAAPQEAEATNATEQTQKPEFKNNSSHDTVQAEKDKEAAKAKTQNIADEEDAGDNGFNESLNVRK